MVNSVPVRSVTYSENSFVIGPPRSSEGLGGVYPSDYWFKWAYAQGASKKYVGYTMHRK